MTRTIDRIIYVYEINAKTTSTKRAKLLNKVAMVGEILFAGGLIAYMFFAFLGFLYSIVGYFWLHEHRPMLIIYIPFLDEDTTKGFAILMAVQTVEIFFAFASSASGDFSYMLVVVNVWTLTSIFGENVNELSEILRENKVDMSLARAKLRNICDMYYDVWM